MSGPLVGRKGEPLWFIVSKLLEEEKQDGETFVPVCGGPTDQHSLPLRPSCRMYRIHKTGQ